MDITIKNSVYKQISDYCKVNNLDVNDYINSLIQKLVTADIYGEVPDFVKLSETKKEVREERKFKKDFERLQNENENLLKDIENYKETISEHQIVINRILESHVQDVKKLNDKIQELTCVDVDEEKTEETEQQFVYDFSQFISQETEYEEKKEAIKENNKPKKRRL